MRSIWTGSIGFGLVNIPVKMYSASQESSLDFDMLDRHDLSNIKYKRVNESTGREVNWNDIVKGYKYENDYVVLTKDDFEKADAKKTKLIEIVDFVDQEEIDSSYFETPYYLEPDKSGIKPYTLLREALKKTKKVGVATYVLRNRENLAVVKAKDNVIILNKIRFPEELRDPSELNIPEQDIKGKELEMAIQLIEQLSRQFEISEYKDTYSAELMRIIEAKAKGKKPVYKEMKVVPSKTQDLMSLLKASLDQKRGSERSEMKVSKRTTSGQSKTSDFRKKKRKAA
jgi:DNA end-binding protein Ku